MMLQKISGDSRPFLRVVSGIILLFIVTEVRSQTPGLGTWTLLNVKKNFTSKWSGTFEGQVRSQKFYYDFFYHEVKLGVGYLVDPHLQLIAGIGNMETYQYEGNFEYPVRGNEFRIWEQVNLQQQFGQIKIIHGYRAEQRFSTSGYRNRFRYRLNTIIPISKTNFAINLYDEIFLSDKKPYFERNRFFAGVNYKINSAFSLQGGVVHQYDYNKNINPFIKNFLLTSLQIDLDHLKKSNATKS